MVKIIETALMKILSWNCGVEGETDDLEINSLRRRQIKNFAAILLLSQGVPMILAGDEVRRTQRGNNNTYCHDNEINWFDWNLVEKNADIFRFFKLMISFRKRHQSLRRRDFFKGEVNERGLGDISWHNCQLFYPGWNDSCSRTLAFTLGGFEGEADIHVIFNMYWESLNFELFPLEDRSWYRVIDTAEASPRDILESGKEIKISDNNYLVKEPQRSRLYLPIISIYRQEFSLKQKGKTRDESNRLFLLRSNCWICYLFSPSPR